MLRLSFISLLCCILLSACAQLPSVDYDMMRAKDLDGQQGHLELLRQQGEQIAGIPFIAGNKVTLLRDGAATYPAMLAAIASAHKQIDMESFTFDEKEGRQFARALLKRRDAGVEVNLIYDSIGSDDTPPDLFAHLKARGIHVVEYNPVDPASLIDSSFNHRDHRKLLIVDGRVVFTGGLNVSQLYRTKLNFKHKFNRDYTPEDSEKPAPDPEKTPWRDTHVKIEGPVVAQFENLFMETWKEQNGQPALKPPVASKKVRGDLMVQALDGTPDMERFSIYKSLLVSMTLAKKSIHLTTAFFIPTPDMIDVLQAAAQRGVDVSLVLPSYSDSDLSIDAGHSFYDELLEDGVHIYERQGAVLHAKTAVIDGVWSTVGSSNLDWRSVLFNDECNAVILGPAFGQQMENMFQDDIAASKEIKLQQWQDRPLDERAHEWKARLVEYYL